jgi:arabinogalactan endo-1,4-beta-galactosidase
MVRALSFAVYASLALTACAAAESPAVFASVDANYSLHMEQEGTSWKWNGEAIELYQGMAKQGVQGMRVRLWTGDEGVNGKKYATEVVKRSVAAGLEPYLVIFLSDDWADLMKQPVPKVWSELDLDDRCAAVRTYSRDVVTHFRNEGLKSHLYEIGNEIDYGICGVYPGKSTKKSPESLSRICWPDAAQLIVASQAGVRESDPDATFMLHIAHWWDVDFCIAFFQFMKDHGVQIDYAGLSYFPSSNIGGSLEMQQFGSVVTQVSAAIDRPIIVPETAYPNTSDFKGQFGRWKKEVPGYPLSDDGQRRWISDFLNFCAHHPNIDSVYYWSPEWCGEGMWKAFALFDVDGDARPAWQAFAGARGDRPALKSNVYYELRGGRLFSVPIDEARPRAAALLAGKLAEHGGLNVDYIREITAERMTVGDYHIHLRASLSGNLDLSLVEQPITPVDWRMAIEKLAPHERMVVYCGPDEDAAAAALRALAVEADSEPIVHPNPPGRPLKFGLTGLK